MVRSNKLFFWEAYRLDFSNIFIFNSSLTATSKISCDCYHFSVSITLFFVWLIFSEMPSTGSNQLFLVRTLFDHLVFALFSEPTWTKRCKTILSFSFRTDGPDKPESAATASRIWTDGKIRIRFCPYAGKYGSEEVRILVYFTH